MSEGPFSTPVCIPALPHNSKESSRPLASLPSHSCYYRWGKKLYKQLQVLYHPPSLTLPWNLIKEKKNKENLSVWKSKVTSVMHPLVFVSPARSTKDFSGPEAACNVSRAKNKMNDFATKQNENLSPSSSSLTWNSPPSNSHWHSIGKQDFRGKKNQKKTSPLFLCPTKRAGLSYSKG